jgi:hypothetical protein
MKYFGTVLILVACATTFVFSNAQESPSPAEEQPSISPDKKWGYIGGDTPKPVKLSTDETVIDFFEQRNPGTAPAGQDPELLWAPDSKRFGFNYSPMHAHHMMFQSIVFYQLRGDKWVALRSPVDETSKHIERAQSAQLRKTRSPKDASRKHFGDADEVRKWADANTAILHTYSDMAVSETPISAHFLFTLKFDDAGNWKIIKTHRMSRKNS